MIYVNIYFEKNQEQKIGVSILISMLFINIILIYFSDYWWMIIIDMSIQYTCTLLIHNIIWNYVGVSKLTSIHGN